MPRSTTLKDIAERAGVHRTTVSMALRSHPSIPIATRERIREIAEKLNYRPNPLVTALMRARRTGSSLKHASIAFVTNHSTRFGWRSPSSPEPDYFPGAADRARELGYKLEHFWLKEPGMTADRFVNILRTRGIYGLLIGRLPVGVHSVDLNWDGFSAVAFGLTLESPLLDHVGENHFESTRRATMECIERDYRRIGFVFSAKSDYPLVEDRWLGGYFCQQRRLSRKAYVPPYMDSPADPARFLSWFERWRPDALVVSLAKPVIDMLALAKYRVPEDVGVVALRNEEPALGHTGLYYDPAKIGALGVDMLIGSMHRNETGVPADPHEVLLKGEWCEGCTLRPRV